ncbi:hypothetical protein Tco_0973375 [Tanacetum coccineum]
MKIGVHCITGSHDVRFPMSQYKHVILTAISIEPGILYHALAVVVDGLLCSDALYRYISFVYRHYSPYYNYLTIIPKTAISNFGLSMGIDPHEFLDLASGIDNSNSCRDVAVLTARGNNYWNTLNLMVRCCGREFRVLNGYDQKSFDEERGLN